MEEEDDDPVVEEIPVFLSKALADSLYIYQYPARPGNRDWTDLRVTNASIKPKNKLVKVEFGLDVESDTYCPSKGEQIAINTDGFHEYSRNKDKEAHYFKSNVMDKMVFESTTPCLEATHYAVGMLQDKELHCTPIEGFVQLRPTFSYFDKQDKRKHDKNKTETSDEEEKEPEAQQVTVKFARQETEIARKARERSYETMSQRINEEPWYDVTWKHCDSDYADLERLKLFSATSLDSSELDMNAREYVRALVPAPPEDEADVAPTELPSPADQLRQLLLDAKLMTFTDLRPLIKSDSGPLSDVSLLSLLGAAACCVRGLWTIRSADLYTRATPVPPRLMCAARDHVLYLFTQHPYVDRRKVAAAVRLPPLEVLHIIRSVAKFNPDSMGWELIVPPDIGFEEKYPEVIVRQNMFWEARQRLFNDMMIGENVPKRQRKKSQRDSISSDTMLSPKPRGNSVCEDDSERKRLKTKITTGSGRRSRNISSSSGQDGM